jgi:sodium/hydrogen exchanger 8
MGMSVFTGLFKDYDIIFSALALTFCFFGRFMNIFPLSFVSNLCRQKGTNHISIKLQTVLWFAGLRGAIAFALAMNMPGYEHYLCIAERRTVCESSGFFNMNCTYSNSACLSSCILTRPNRDVYATATLSICIFTTIVCGGLTEGMLTLFGMKEHSADDNGANDEDHDDGLGTMNRLSFSPPSSNPPRRHADYPIARQASRRVYKGAKRLWKQFDDEVLKPYLGGSTSVRSATDGFNGGDNLGNYELGMTNGVDDYD